MKLKIRKGDQVEVITGRLEDKGKRGEVIKVNAEEERVVVQGINMRSKHQKQVQSQGRTVNPGKIRFEAELSVSNVMMVCKKCNKPTRISLVREGSKTKRFCKKCNADLDL
ncbi:MAG: 50S ribosomal protein L24 [Anaerolineaceae bacterium]